MRERQKKKTKARIDDTKNWFFEKTDKPLTNLTKIRREKTQFNKFETKRGDKNKHQENPGNHQGLL
jgi:hypothetical protein